MIDAYTEMLASGSAQSAPSRFEAEPRSNLFNLLIQKLEYPYEHSRSSFALT
jgi:hypothetical protein